MDEERDLIRRVQRHGDRAAADALVRKYYDEIFGFVRKQTPGDDEALDVTQDVFIWLLRTIGRYDPKPLTAFSFRPACRTEVFARFLETNADCA
ncbi:MAG: hypothetical protein LBJ64_12390 [Deltaproteobacteria bacterium]|nr:hypothetical protein [Deltaproteobacteria bacterium]